MDKKEDQPPEQGQYVLLREKLNRKVDNFRFSSFIWNKPGT